MTKAINKKRLTLNIIISAVVLLAIVISVLMAFPYRLNRKGVEPLIQADAHNVILLIGDGMGFNHIEIASYFDTPVMTGIENQSVVSTHSLAPILATDSAAAATAISTGVKVGNGRISYKNGKPLTNLGDMASEYGKKLGIVTTKSVTDATPAAFSAHNRSRKNEKAIALEQVNNAGIDVLLGLGRQYFDGYANVINNNTRAYVTTFAELKANTKPKVYGIFDDPIPTQGEFTLASLTEIALAMLENDDGFFLMVEGAKIDIYSHDNDMANMLAEFWGFDAAVAVALAYAEQNPNTTVIVTADHETGKLNIPKTLSEETINNKAFKSKQHTNREVPFFIYGPGADEIPAKIDNTDIFLIINQLLFG